MSKEDPIKWVMTDNVIAYQRRSFKEKEARREFYRNQGKFNLSLHGAYREWPLFHDLKTKPPKVEVKVETEPQVIKYGDWGIEVIKPLESPQKSLEIKP